MAIDFQNIITGEKFINTTEYKFYPGGDDFNIFTNNLEKKIINKDCITVYTHIHFVPKLFEFIKSNEIDNKIVLVSHNSDYSVNEKLFNSKPDNVIHWFSQNVEVENKILESIPIGLENNRWFGHINKKEKMFKKLNENKKIKNLLYINHNISTFPQERDEPYKIFKDKNWVTLEYGKNGQNFENYLDNIHNHKFVLSPRGNGIDTHRLWECLYMKTIPIEKRNINNHFFEDLPICFVDEWSEINESFLEKKYEEINSKKWNLEKLNFSYWENKIKNYEKSYCFNFR